MKTTMLEFSEQEIGTIRSLVGELNSYYEGIYDSNKEWFQTWNFDDVDNQRQIACELAGILESKLNIL